MSRKKSSNKANKQDTAVPTAAAAAATSNEQAAAPGQAQQEDAPRSPNRNAAVMPQSRKAAAAAEQPTRKADLLSTAADDLGDAEAPLPPPVQQVWVCDEGEGGCFIRRKLSSSHRRHKQNETPHPNRPFSKKNSRCRPTSP
jgi:hypothetical protein